jgi:Fur family ferric uptake transcriptional regulator
MKKASSISLFSRQTSAEMLRESGLRATPGRIELIDVLAQEREPITVRELMDKLPTPLNEVTLYRALEALAEVGLVTQVDLQHGHAHYELAATRKHHHHLVCTDCGVVEDFVNETCEASLAGTAKKSNLFKVVTSHSMEVFGLCKSCA